MNEREKANLLLVKEHFPSANVIVEPKSENLVSACAIVNEGKMRRQITLDVPREAMQRRLRRKDDKLTGECGICLLTKKGRVCCTHCVEG